MPGETIGEKKKKMKRMLVAAALVAVLIVAGCSRETEVERQVRETRERDYKVCLEIGREMGDRKSERVRYCEARHLDRW